MSQSDESKENLVDTFHVLELDVDYDQSDISLGDGDRSNELYA